jgi:hypothetical protein
VDSLLNRDPINRNNGSFLTAIDFSGSGSGKDKYNSAWMSYVLFFIHLGSRRVSIAGITDHPDASWMSQVARKAINQITWPAEMSRESVLASVIMTESAGRVL